MANTELQTNKTIREVRLKQRPFVGFIAWAVQRATALILFFLLPIKIYSGYAITGKLPGVGVISTLHLNAVLDALLIFALIFHALYGLRVILIDVGIVKDNRSVFTIFTALAAVLCAMSFYVIVS